MKKILMLTRRFWPEVGGVERHVLEVSKELIKRGYEVTVLTEKAVDSGAAPPAGGAPQNDEIEGIKVVRMPEFNQNWQKKFRIWRWLFTNRKLIEQADIIHAHDVFFWYLLFRFFFPQKPVYTTFHGWEGKYPPDRKAVLLRKISEKLSRGNICVGDFIGKWYGTKADHVTYGGVTNLPSHLGGGVAGLPGSFATPPRNPFGHLGGVELKKLKIIYIGRLEKVNGIEMYLEALELLKIERVDFEIKFLGRGEYEMKEGLAASDAARPFIVFASSYLSILEALSAGKVVIAVYNNPLKEDYLRMSPFARFILICQNAAEVVQVMKSIVKEPWKYETMVKNGQKWTTSQTWEKVVEKYLYLWQKI